MKTEKQAIEIRHTDRGWYWAFIGDKQHGPHATQAHAVADLYAYVMAARDGVSK